MAQRGMSVVNSALIPLCNVPDHHKTLRAGGRPKLKTHRLNMKPRLCLLRHNMHVGKNSMEMMPAINLEMHTHKRVSFNIPAKA